MGSFILCSKLKVRIMSLKLFLKTTSGHIIETFADPDLTIYDLKAICCEELQTEPDEQTLLFGGKVCNDDSTLESIKITNNSTLIVLLKKKKKHKKNKTEQSEQDEKKEQQNDNNHQNNNNQRQQQQMMMPSLMNNNNMMSSMQQSLMQNPDLMKQMMNNPMMKQMFNNPELLQNLFNSNPALQQLLKDNPQLRHVLKDPSLMKHAMKAASNPEYYNEMLKNNDRALRNIESIPGGFSALSRLYNQIQKPMERAMDDMYRQRHGKDMTTITAIDKSNGPTTKPLQNPWSKQYHQQKQQQQQPLQQQQQSVFGNNNMNMMNMMSQMNMNNNNNQMNGNPSQIYVIQLRELRNMGFNDEQRNINALIASGGNVAAAIQHLIGDNSSNNTDNDKNKK